MSNHSIEANPPDEGDCLPLEAVQKRPLAQTYPSGPYAAAATAAWFPRPILQARSRHQCEELSANSRHHVDEAFNHHNAVFQRARFVVSDGERRWALRGSNDTRDAHRGVTSDPAFTSSLSGQQNDILTGERMENDAALNCPADQTDDDDAGGCRKTVIKK
ncbi:hypothetical protein MRX96_032086 [Rhipicephalus microplus]